MGLTDEQYGALKVLKDRIQSGELVSILQGPAGSGKSFTLKCLLEELGYAEDEAYFTAFTGNAAKLLMDNGLNASTIHKLIYKPIVSHGRIIGFAKKPERELRGLKLIIVDEFSMVSEELMKDLLSYKIPLLLVGDHYQLPPIGKPNEFTNQCHARLETVMRQALESSVLWAATRIRKGEIVKEGIHGEGNNALFVGRKHQLDENWLRKDVQFLVGLNQTRVKLNNQISGSALPQVGDKIIFLKNDWESFIVNGSITTLENFTENWRNKYHIAFHYDGMDYERYFAYYQEEPKNHRRTKRDPRNVFDKAFAITTHKAQGSTINAPMCIVDESGVFRQYAKNWQYTALTRSTGNYPVAFLR